MAPQVVARVGARLEAAEAAAVTAVTAAEAEAAAEAYEVGADEYEEEDGDELAT